MKAEFELNGKIVGKGRPRFTRTGHVYTPKQTSDYEKLVKASYYCQCGRKKFKDAIGVYITAKQTPPTKMRKAEREEAIRESMNSTKKPDADNIAKVVLDALNGLAYEDDKQISCLKINKVYAESEGIHVLIKELGEMNDSI